MTRGLSLLTVTMPTTAGRVGDFRTLMAYKEERMAGHTPTQLLVSG